MKLVRWKRFAWDLTKLPAFESRLPSAFNIRAASRDEEKTVHQVIFTAFGLDTAWGDSIRIVREFIEAQLAASFAHRAVPCLVLTHGTRIIAASALNVSEDAPSHLISGPCVLSEYRSRGIGTTLLHESLEHLKAAGLATAYGVSKENVPASRFIYPKFESTHVDFDFEGLLAAK
ncbi:MAG: GNAT family N-acetyltransferase [Verrucomicrobiota bacterium]|jgi:predicted N-acetyltransferase YhbS